jgi:AcrR family transcriptional regulator
MVSDGVVSRHMGITPARQRMLDAALYLAAEHGYEGLQVRAIAQRASVSSRTIYENFPSLESLLIIAVAEQAGELYRRFTETPPRSGTAAARVRKLTEELTEVMTANRRLAIALLRALVCGKPDVAQHIRGFSEVLLALVGAAIAPDGPNAADREAAELLERIWFSALIGWATEVDSSDHINTIMRRASLRILEPA